MGVEAALATATVTPCIPPRPHRPPPAHVSGTTFGPPGNRRLVYFVDDINLPEVDPYNTQQVRGWCSGGAAVVVAMAAVVVRKRRWWWRWRRRWRRQQRNTSAGSRTSAMAVVWQPKGY